MTPRRSVIWLLVLCGLIVVGSFLYSLFWDKPVRPLPLSRETTYFTGPLDAEGYIDYKAALNDLLSEGVTPETNANVLIWQAIGPRPEGVAMPPELFRRLGISEPPPRGNYFTGLTEFLKHRLKLHQAELEVLLEQEDELASKPWEREEHPFVAAWLDANEEPLMILLEATRRPRYYNPLVSISPKPTPVVFALLPNVPKCREAVKALTARAMLKVAEGDYESAWQDLLACHRLARLLGQGSTLVEYISGLAVEQMACQADLVFLDSANLTSEQIKRYLGDLQALPPLSSPADKFDVAERVVCLDMLQLARRGEMGQFTALGTGTPSRKATWFERQALANVDWEPVFRNANEWYDRLAKALRENDRTTREKALQEIDAELARRRRDLSGPNIVFAWLSPRKNLGVAISETLMSLLTPAVLRVQKSHEKTEQTHRNLLIAFALAAYRSEHGQYPETLDALAPEYLPTVPNDVFTGKPLIYRRTQQGYLLYSPGPNDLDEAGRGADDDPRGDDISVRMPRNETRRRD
ncbi:MAG: hypothetical protein NZM31_03385 [Gemmatales bacterium]|nr:hypothetical protein [Gemmatales bacterium]MDW8386042.1 hypothetical protein [Gemmatales bacterium]